MGAPRRSERPIVELARYGPRSCLRSYAVPRVRNMSTCARGIARSLSGAGEVGRLIALVEGWMKRRRKIPQRHAVVATVIALVWLPYAGTRCLENPGGPSDSVNCIFHHHESHTPGGDHHDAAPGVGGYTGKGEPSQDRVRRGGQSAARHHDHHRDDTCCTRTGKRSVIPSAFAGAGPSAVVGPAWLVASNRPAPADHVVAHALAPVAHSPPIYLRNATLLI
jgi:hypothetical protein